jgi:hypothetical protein
MFVIYPQAAQAQYVTVDSIEERVIDFEWEIPFSPTWYAKIKLLM